MECCLVLLWARKQHSACFIIFVFYIVDGILFNSQLQHKIQYPAWYPNTKPLTWPTAVFSFSCSLRFPALKCTNVSIYCIHYSKVLRGSRNSSPWLQRRPQLHLPVGGVIQLQRPLYPSGQHNTHLPG